MSQMRAGLVGIVAGTEQVVLQMTAECGDRRGVPNGSGYRRFHDLAAAAGNERSPRVDRCVGHELHLCLNM